jgi:hypothetical protein
VVWDEADSPDEHAEKPIGYQLKRRERENSKSKPEDGWLKNG